MSVPHVPLHGNASPAIIVVTEGELKADIVTALDPEGRLAISVPGVSNFRACFPLLALLRSGDDALTVQVAFDQEDWARKKQVARAVLSVVRELRQVGFQTELLAWDREDGKGLDDLIASGGKAEVVRGEQVDPYLGGIAAQAGLAIDGGATPRTKGPRDRKRGSLTDRLVTMAEGLATELWHAPDGTPYATVAIDGHLEHWSVTSRVFTELLRRQFYRRSRRAPPSRVFEDALATVAAIAQHEGLEHEVHLRVAAHEGAIFIDLCNSQWEVARVCEGGWEVLTVSPVRFRRVPRSMHALPRPVPGGPIELLGKYINVADRKTLILIVAWLLACLQPPAPYPILVVQGEQGSAKSTVCRILRQLIDPASADLRALPRTERDLAVMADGALVLAFDNVSDLPPWLSDALCRVATGTAFGTRTLYTDRGEEIFELQRPIALNSIDEILYRPDLADRAFVVTLPPIPPSQRRGEEELWEAFRRDRPLILGALLDAVQAALRNRRRVVAHAWPRMADAARWAVAAGHALPWGPDAVLRTIQEQEIELRAQTAESSPVARALVELLDQEEAARGLGGVWEGTVGGLLRALNELVPLEQRPRFGWPATARGLTSTLRRVGPALRSAGIEVDSSLPRGPTGKPLAIRRASPQEEAPMTVDLLLEGRSSSSDTQTVTAVIDSQVSENAQVSVTQESNLDGCDGCDGHPRPSPPKASHERPGPETGPPLDSPDCRQGSEPEMEVHRL